MKKIVALVLSLVMVLGLATTAFAADLTGSYTFKATTEDGMKADAVAVSDFKVNDAKAPKDVNKNKVIDDDEVGFVKFFTATNIPGDALVQVATVSEADYVVYYGNTETVFGYFAAVDKEEVFYYGTPAAFNNFGKACGQVDIEPTEGVKYYTFENKVYEATKTASQKALMIDGKVTLVDEVVKAVNPHTVAFTYDKDYKVVGVKCAVCNCAATIYNNFASVPENAVSFGLGDGRYYVWTATAAPEAGDKVTSAETFDAGIAMYVGMSVMAAAGSAVVLKKKD